MSPASEISCSIVGTPDRRHPSTWESYQRTPETKSTVYGLAEHGDDPSDRQHEADTPTAPPFTPFETRRGFMDEEALIPRQLEDIYAQHDMMAVDTSITSEQDDTHGELSLSSTGPNEDKIESPQAKPEDEIHNGVKHE